MKKWFVMLLAAMMMCLLPVNTLAVPSNVWNANNVYVISGVHESKIEIHTYDKDEYFLVLDHADLKRIDISPAGSGYNQSPTVHIIVKGENKIINTSTSGITCGGTVKLIIEPASMDASLKIEGKGLGAIDSDGDVISNGFGNVNFSMAYPTNREYSKPEFIVPVPGSEAVPATGDGANLMLWLGMLAVSAIGMMILGRRVGKEY